MDGAAGPGQAVRPQSTAPLEAPPPPQPATPPAPTPVAPWIVQAGDNFYIMARATLADALGRPPTELEVHEYVQRMADHNGIPRSELGRDLAANPLIHPGDRFDMPPVHGDPRQMGQPEGRATGPAPGGQARPTPGDPQQQSLLPSQGTRGYGQDMVEHGSPAARGATVAGMDGSTGSMPSSSTPLALAGEAPQLAAASRPAAIDPAAIYATPRAVQQRYGLPETIRGDQLSQLYATMSTDGRNVLQSSFASAGSSLNTGGAALTQGRAGTTDLFRGLGQQLRGSAQQARPGAGQASPATIAAAGRATAEAFAAGRGIPGTQVHQPATPSGGLDRAARLAGQAPLVPGGSGLAAPADDQAAAVAGQHSFQPAGSQPGTAATSASARPSAATGAPAELVHGAVREAAGQPASAAAPTSPAAAAEAGAPSVPAHVLAAPQAASRPSGLAAGAATHGQRAPEEAEHAETREAPRRLVEAFAAWVGREIGLGLSTGQARHLLLQLPIETREVFQSDPGSALAESPQLIDMLLTLIGRGDPADDAADALLRLFDHFVAREPSPEQVHYFFDSLSPAQVDHLVSHRLEVLSNLPGVPRWVFTSFQEIVEALDADA